MKNLELKTIIFACVACLVAACGSETKLSSQNSCERVQSVSGVKFAYDSCAWTPSVRRGPDFKVLSFADEKGESVVGLYVGSAPSVEFVLSGQRPQPQFAPNGYRVEEVMQGSNYEALVYLPEKRGAPRTYVHLFGKNLRQSDKNRAIELTKSIKKE